MNPFLTYLIVFAVGGAICCLGQVLVNLTKMTTARTLVIFLFMGVLLQAFGVFEPIKNFAQSGITIPIIGFGANLARGAIEGASKEGLIGALLGGTKAAAAGLSGAIFIGFVVAMFARAKTKR